MQEDKLSISSAQFYREKHTYDVHVVTLCALYVTLVFMPSLPRRFAAQLKQLREERGLAQKVLAEKADVSREYVVRMELELHEPTLSMVEKLAKALKVSIGELLGEE